MTPQDPNAAINRRFDLLRQRQEQAGNKAKQDANEDIKRQAAARGRLGSGMTQKLGMQANEQIDQQQSANIADVESGREQSLFQQAEVDRGREFAKSERLGSQDFAAQQAQKQMQFAQGERLGSQDFAKSQMLAQQGFDMQIFNKNMDWQKTVFNEQNRQWEKQLAENITMFDKQYDLDSANTEFNKMMAEKQFNKPELMDMFWKTTGNDPKTGDRTGPFAKGTSGARSKWGI
jgi:hypothetical protein